MATALTCTDLTLRDGVLTGRIDAPAGTALPTIELVVRNEVVAVGDTRAVADTPGVHLLTLAVPSVVLTEGLVTLILRVERASETLASLPIAVGEPLSLDILAELDLLRAELDMLKRAVRRQIGLGGL
ncbi:MAG: hypothetical protein AAGJ96_08235 [Pseudomonadota bacterium]